MNKIKKDDFPTKKYYHKGKPLEKKDKEKPKKDDKRRGKPRVEKQIKGTHPYLLELQVDRDMILLDFLLLKMTKLSRNNVKSLLSHQQVLVEGAAVSQFDFQLAKGDLVQISKHSMKMQKQIQDKLKILYEDDEIIAINKPHGLLSVATDKEKINTAYKEVMDYVRLKNPKNRVFVVHRLDKETSGVLMFCKNQELKDAFQDNWNNLVTKRQYIAVCEGKFEKKEGSITTYLRETKTNLMYSSFTENDGKKATTKYEVIKENDSFSLVKVLIMSGRKNQIRVHMRDLKHQVVGDEKYQSSTNPIGRLGLHARLLAIKHPTKDQEYTFVAETPNVFLNMFKK